MQNTKQRPSASLNRSTNKSPPSTAMDALQEMISSNKMTHAITRDYNTEEKMANLRKKITNQMIENCRQCIYDDENSGPSGLERAPSDVEGASSAVEETTSTVDELHLMLTKIHLMSTKLHLLSTKQHLMSTKLHLMSRELHLLPTKLHLLATKSNLLPTRALASCCAV